MAKIKISADLDCAHPTPVRFPLPTGLPEGKLQIREESGAWVAPAQRDGQHLVALIANVPAGRSRTFHVESVADEKPGVTLKEDGEHSLVIELPDGPFTTYRHNPAEARPYFYPVAGPGGKHVTRNYPMAKVEGEDRDHPHHRSFWTAYGEVNETDDWSEEPKHGFIRHQKFTKREEGPTFGGFTAELLWTSMDNKPLLDERRTIRVYNVGADRRLLDYSVELTASYDEIHYGDTKEGGLLAFRVATSMDGSKGGRIENSLGGVTEKECWGKRATWLDYSGPVDGETLGIGMMDHPGNFHHPCYWHARDYGLVSTNPFAGPVAFEHGKVKQGSTQAKGSTLAFHYRVLIHRGGAKEGRVDDAYHAWIQGPQPSKS